MSKLIGKQAKLDRNNNGKLDREDFKMLRSGKKRKDEQFIDRVINILVERRLEELSIPRGGSEGIKQRVRKAEAEKKPLPDVLSPIKGQSGNPSDVLRPRTRRIIKASDEEQRKRLNLPQRS